MIESSKALTLSNFCHKVTKPLRDDFFCLVSSWQRTSRDLPHRAPSPLGGGPGRGVRRRPGFTLIEVVIAVFIAAVALVGLLEIFTIDLRSAGNARAHLAAATSAQRLMEQAALTHTGPGIVTINVPWSTTSGSGNIVLVREFF